jgi:hydrogenase expression/formation protein HypD
MRYINEFRNKEIINRVSQKIFEIMPDYKISVMEVCGTHTQSFYRFGLERLLPENLKLIAGPGCPVCVSEQDYIDKATQLSKDTDVIILSFGDMLRVPGTYTNLEKQRAEGSDVRLVYSSWDVIKVAKNNPAKKVVFLAVGFETTAPTLALTILAAKKEKIKNLFLLSSLKLIPPAMKTLLFDEQIKIDGFLCPGHVSTIIGSQAYEFIPRQHKIGCCVAGFEPLDILEGIYFLIRQIVQNKPRVENQYVRVVKKQGNPTARAIIKKVFKIVDAAWRGLGQIPQSGLQLRDEFSSFDIERTMSLKIKYKIFPATKSFKVRSGIPLKNKSLERKKIRQRQCRCGDVLRGIIQPPECPLFRRTCSPNNPYGPCMISKEGACNAYYRYK